MARLLAIYSVNTTTGQIRIAAWSPLFGIKKNVQKIWAALWEDPSIDPQKIRLITDDPGQLDWDGTPRTYIVFPNHKQANRASMCKLCSWAQFGEAIEEGITAKAIQIWEELGSNDSVSVAEAVDDFEEAD